MATTTGALPQSTIETITLKTADYPSGIPLAAYPWTVSYTQNPDPEYIHQTDWSGGVDQKIFPIERRRSESDILSNMMWSGKGWSANGNVLNAGPLKAAAAGTAVTTACNYFQIYNGDLFFATGAKKYYTDAGTNPTEADAGGSATITDMDASSDKLVVSLDTNTFARTFDGSTWANATYKSYTSAYIRDKLYWASNPTGGSGNAGYLYWGSTAADRVSVSNPAVPIRRIVEAMEDIILIKDGAMFAFNPSTKLPIKIQNLPTNANNGRAAEVYNNALYFSCGEQLWVWRGTNACEPVPTPSRIDSTQIGRVYSLHSVELGLLVGFKGYVYLMVEDPPQSGKYWWHFVAYDASSTFNSIAYAPDIWQAPTRIYFATAANATNNINYITLTQGTFTPATYTTGTQVIFPGIYSGPERFPIYLYNIRYGTSGCDANNTIAWHASSDLTNWTAVGSAATTNGFQTATPSTDINGATLWLRATFTLTGSGNPTLDFWRICYFSRPPTVRLWKMPVDIYTNKAMPGGGKQWATSIYETALYAARNQTNPCTLTVPSQGITDVKVVVDIANAVRSVDRKLNDVRPEVYTLIFREVAG